MANKLNLNLKKSTPKAAMEAKEKPLFDLLNTPIQPQKTNPVKINGTITHFLSNKKKHHYPNQPNLRQHRNQ